MSLFAGLIGLVDLLAAIALYAAWLGHPIPHLQAGMALGLVGKGVLFLPNFLSVVDIAIGVLMFLMFWWNVPLLAISCAIWLTYKGVYAWA